MKLKRSRNGVKGFRVGSVSSYVAAPLWRYIDREIYLAIELLIQYSRI